MKNTTQHRREDKRGHLVSACEPIKPKKLVLAGSTEQFRHYFPQTDRNIINVVEVSQLFGYHNCEWIRVGTWWEREQRLIDAFEIAERYDHCGKQKPVGSWKG